MADYADFVEKAYAWFLKTMKKPPEYQVFRGRKCFLWILKDKPTVLKWYENYRNDYSLDIGDSRRNKEGKGPFLQLIERGSGNIHTNNLGIIVPAENSDIRNQIAHMAGHFMISAFAPGLEGSPPSWLSEAFGHMTEHALLGNGTINCSTLAKYAESGGVQEKEFATKSAHDIAKGIARNGDDDPFISLNKLELNSLNAKHLAKGWTIVEWLLKQKHEQFVAFVEGLNQAEMPEALAGAIDGWTPESVDKAWREHVMKNF
jgi:hypothetical protein